MVRTKSEDRGASHPYERPGPAQGPTRSLTVFRHGRLAWSLFHGLFRDKIISLVTQYPEDAVDKEGRAFWTGALAHWPSLSTNRTAVFRVGCAALDQ